MRLSYFNSLKQISPMGKYLLVDEKTRKTFCSALHKFLVKVLKKKTDTKSINTVRVFLLLTLKKYCSNEGLAL